LNEVGTFQKNNCQNRSEAIDLMKPGMVEYFQKNGFLDF